MRTHWTISLRASVARRRQKQHDKDNEREWHCDDERVCVEPQREILKTRDYLHTIFLSVRECVGYWSCHSTCLVLKSIASAMREIFQRFADAS